MQEGLKPEEEEQAGTKLSQQVTLPATQEVTQPEPLEEEPLEEDPLEEPPEEDEELPPLEEETQSKNES